MILENVAKKPYWLDIGAGSNIVIKEQPGAEFAVGIDIEKWDTVFRDNKTAAFCVGTADALPFKPDSFDFITSRYTFEHLESPEVVIEDISRVLRPGGLFVMQTTNKNNLFVLLSRMIPFAIKKALFGRLFKDNPSRTFKTWYRFNTPRAINEHTGLLTLDRLIMVEDILCQNGMLHFLSGLLYRVMELFGLESLRGNMIAVYRKKG